MDKNSTFIENLRYVEPIDVMKLFTQVEKPLLTNVINIKNDVKPVDLYCYLYARFGVPNGIQNILKSEGSDNLIHWEWFLKSGSETIIIQGLTYRTTFAFSDQTIIADQLKNVIVPQLKHDFRNYGNEMQKIRNSFEHWIEFVNPYQRIKRSIYRLTEELSSLDLDKEPMEFTASTSHESFQVEWEEKTTKLSKAFGLCFGVRMMLPVLGEAFVNLLLFVLMKPELKKDDRIRENLIREPIDIRIKTLSHNCSGFAKSVNYSSQECKDFHTLVNDRNDLLHGNVRINKLQFNELFFDKNTPLFIEYSSMWDRSIGVELKAVGLDSVSTEREVVDSFIQYLLSCLDEQNRVNITQISEQYDLGLSKDDGHLGVLFPPFLADFVMGPPRE